MKITTQPLSRRAFISGTLAATALAGVPVLHAEGLAPRRKIKIGFVGCGRRGFWIAKLFRQHGGYDPYAVADYFPGVAESKGKDLGVAPQRCFSGLSGYQRVIDSGVEAIVLELPPYFFPSYAYAAVEAGLHVYMAKPVAVDVPGSLTILECGRQATAKRRCFFVDYQMPTDPVNIEIRKRILEGALGEFAWVETIGFSGHLPDPPKTATIESRMQNLIWCNDIALGGDYVVNYDIHAVDAALWVLGQRPVVAMGASRICRPRPHGDSRDVCQVVFEYANGLVHNHRSQALNAENVADPNLTAKIYGRQAYAELVYYQTKSILRGGEKSMAGKVENLYQLGAQRNIATFYDNIVTDYFDNEIVPRAVDGCLTCILGREAAARHTRLAMDELLRENKRWEVDLTGLKV